MRNRGPPRRPVGSVTEAEWIEPRFFWGRTMLVGKTPAGPAVTAIVLRRDAGFFYLFLTAGK
jgi:hypothetical protein